MIKIPISNFISLQKYPWMVDDGSIKYICTLDGVPIFFQHNNNADAQYNREKRLDLLGKS